MKGKFDVVLHSPAEQLPRAAWADRVLAVLKKLAVLTGDRPLETYRRGPVTVELQRSEIERLMHWCTYVGPERARRLDFSLCSEIPMWS